MSQRLYREKHLSNKSEVEAQVKTLFSSAAQKGHPGAMLEYAHILYRTHSDHDESKANRLNIKYLLDAAERGHLMGMELLAYQLDVGFGFDGRLNFDDGIFRNQNLGMQWFRVAAEQGSATAMFELGRRLQTGIPTISKPNYRRALFWLTKATELGQASAYFHLAVMYDRGWAVERSVVQAATYIYRNIKIDDVEALIHLRDRRLHTVISRAVWKKLQVFMRNDGFYEGAIDGLYGVAMRKALHKAGGKKIRKSLAR